jgi:hypothetical protein
VVARIAADAVLLDLRSVPEIHDELVATSIAEALSR